MRASFVPFEDFSLALPPTFLLRHRTLLWTFSASLSLPLPFEHRPPCGGAAHPAYKNVKVKGEPGPDIQRVPCRVGERGGGRWVRVVWMKRKGRYIHVVREVGTRWWWPPPWRTARRGHKKPPFISYSISLSYSLFTLFLVHCLFFPWPYTLASLPFFFLFFFFFPQLSTVRVRWTSVYSDSSLLLVISKEKFHPLIFRSLSSHHPVECRDLLSREYFRRDQA